MQKKRFRALALAAVSALISGQSLYALDRNLTWDWDGELPLDGNGGFWVGDGSFPQWTEDSGASYVNWDNSGDHATFAGTVSGTVTVDTTVTGVKSLRFNRNYTLTPLSGNGFTLGTGGTEGIINVANTAVGTIGVPLTLAGGANLNIGNTTNMHGTIVLAAPVTHTGTTILRRATVKLGVDNALPVTQTLNMPEGSLVGTFDLNGFNQTINAFTGATQNTITNSSGTPSTLTVNTLFGGSHPFLSGNLNVIHLGTGSQTLVSGQTFVGTTTFKPTGTAALSVLPVQSGVFGAATNKIVLDSRSLTGAQATINWSSPDNTNYHTYTQDIELQHLDATTTSTSSFARFLIAGAKGITLSGTISGGTVGGLGLVFGGGASASGQGNLVLAGTNTYQGTTIVGSSTHMMTLVSDGALGNSAGALPTDTAVFMSNTSQVLAFANGITLANTKPISIGSNTTLSPSGWANVHSLSGDNIAANEFRWGGSASKFFGAEKGTTLTLTGLLGTISPSEPGGITKIGHGTVILTNQNPFGTSNSGTTNNANATVIKEGTLRLDFSQAAHSEDIINNPTFADTEFNITTSRSSHLQLAGGTLEVKGKADATNVQRFRAPTATGTNGFTLFAGASAIRAVQNGAASLTINTGRLRSQDRLVGSTLDVTLPTTGSIVLPGVGGGIGTTDTILTANGAAFATVGGADWAAVDVNRNIVGGDSIPGFYVSNTANSLGATNANMDGGVDTVLDADATVSSIRFNNAAARTITAEHDVASVLTPHIVTTGGILVTPAVGNNLSKITKGTLRAASGAANQDLVIIQNNTENHLQIDSSIVDNATTSSLTKSGAGKLILSQANTYTGETHINGGMIQLSGPGTISAGRLVFHGGQLGLPGGTTFTRTLQAAAITDLQFLGDAGFAAYGGDVTIRLNNDANIEMRFGHQDSVTPSTHWVTGSAMILGAADSDGMVDFTNRIRLSAHVGPQNWEFRTHDGSAPIDARLSGVIRSAGGLVKTGDGTLQLSTANTYTGATIVEGGTLLLNGGTLTSDSVITVRNGTFNLGTSNHTAGQIGVYMGGGASGTSSTITSTTGTFTLGTSFNYEGSVNNDNGATINGLMSLGSTNKTFNISNSTAAANDVTINANIAATAGGITKVGAGKLLLTGTNGFTGTTNINEGTLAVSGGSALADTVPVVMGNTPGGTLELGSSETIGSLAGTGGTVALGSSTLTTGGTSNTTFAGAISGAGALVKQGTGVMTLTGTSSYSGGTTVNAGLLGVSSNANLGAASSGITLNGGGIRFNASTSLGTRAVSLGASGGTLDSNGNIGTIGGPVTGTGGLTKTGAGTISLTHTGTAYSGDTNLAAGTLEIASGLGTGNIQFNGGGIKYLPGNTADLTAGGRVLAMNNTANVSTTNFIDTGGNNVTFSGDVGTFQLGHFTKAGAGNLTVNGNMHFLGEMRSHGGKLVLGQSTIWPTVARADGGTIELAESSDPDRVLAGGMDIGDGMKTANLGKIDLKNNKGIIYGGTTNTITIGNFNDTVGAMYYTGVYGMVQRGRNGGAWDGGGVNAEGSGGIMTSMPDALAGITGIGVTIATSEEVFGGQTLFQNDVKLMYTFVGDADLDGVIDGDDYLQIDTGYQTRQDVSAANDRYGYDNGDFNYDGLIDADDYWYIDRNYSRQHVVDLKGGPLPVGVGGVSAVPEPGSLALLSLAAVGAMPTSPPGLTISLSLKAAPTASVGAA